MREPVAQLGMCAEVAQLPQTEPPRGGIGDGERIAVVEPERLAHPHSLAREALAHHRDRTAVGRLQNHLGDRAGVLRVGIHVAAAQRLVHDLRAAEIAAVQHADPGLSNQDRERLAQDP